MVGIILELIPPYFGTIWSHKTSETLTFLLLFQYRVVIFSILGGGPEKVNDLLTSPINQFRDYFIRNRLEKLVPLNYKIIKNQKNIKINRPNRFQTLTFGRNLGFQKNPRFVPGSPPGGLYFQKRPQKINKSGNARKHQTSSFFDKMATSFMHFY